MEWPRKPSCTVKRMWLGARPRWEWIALAIFCILLIAVGAVREARRESSLPSAIDIRVYILSANVLAANGDPYDMDTMIRAGTYGAFPYTYPPHTLPAVQPLQGLEPRQALPYWIAIKLAVLTIAGWFAMKWSGLGRRWLLPFLAFATVGFGNGGFHDLRMGNVAAIENSVGALMFALLLARRSELSGLLGALLVVVKPHFLLFSLPGLLTDTKRVLRGLGLGLLFVAPLYAFGAWRYPGFFRNYPHRLMEFDPKLMMGDSVRRDVIVWTGSETLANLLFGLVALAVVGVVVIVFLRWRDRTRDARGMIGLSALAAVLINPRLPYYSNPMIAVPVLSLFADLSLTPLSVGLFLAISAAVPGMHPWLITVPLFLLPYCVLGRTGKTSESEPAESKIS